MLILSMSQKDRNVQQKGVLFLGKSVTASNKAGIRFGETCCVDKLFDKKIPL